MSTAATLRSFISKLSFPAVEHPSCWGVIKIEKMLNEVGISNYELENESRVVNVGGQENLMRILLHLVPYEVSSDYHLTLSRFDDKIKLQIGCWQFEANA